MHIATLLLLIAGQVVEAKGFPKEMQMKAAAATVRIANRSQRSEGTGVILGRDKDGIYVLTTAHVVPHSESLQISTYSTASYPAPLQTYDKVEVLAKTRDIRDLALVRLATEDRPPAVMHLCPLGHLPKGKFKALSAGCGAGNAPTCFLENVSRLKQFRRLGRESASLWETEVSRAPGRSGGPLLNNRGELIGLAIGAREGKGCYCHVAEIHNWLKESKYAFLLDEEEKKK